MHEEKGDNKVSTNNEYFSEGRENSILIFCTENSDDNDRKIRK